MRRVIGRRLPVDRLVEYVYCHFSPPATAALCARGRSGREGSSLEDEARRAIQLVRNRGRLAMPETHADTDELSMDETQ